jgi:SRSO17 transposase
MKTTKREPHAPSAALPELDEFLRPFHAHFSRSEGRQSLERYLTGLLTEHPNKNCDTIAQVVPDTNQQRLHNLLTGIAFDEDDLNDQRVCTLRQLPSEGDAVLIFDDTGFAKQGKCSVGVQRQYSGTLGKTGNCQVTVNCHYAERTLAWPVATRLYLPQEWAYELVRREKAKVPEDVEFQTKPEIALALLDHARELGIRHAAVTADGDYGDNPNFLAGLELRKERYVVAGDRLKPQLFELTHFVAIRWDPFAVRATSRTSASEGPDVGTGTLPVFSLPGKADSSSAIVSARAAVG